MEVIENVADIDVILEQVDPENRDFVREIFLNEDSDEEFLGFDEDDLENDEQIAPFEDNWIHGNLDTRALAFDAEKKLNFDLGENPEMIDFFRLIIDEHFINKLVEETNRYAHDFFQSEQGQQLKPHSRFKLWDDVNRGDMMRFVGMIIGMGLVQQQDLHDYWSKDELLETPFFRKAMPRNKFLLMLSFLHLNNNHNNIPRGQAGHDPIFKIRPFYEHFRTKFQDVYYPGENIAIDEGMVAWRGHLSFRVYLPDKPDKFGVKLFMLCDSSNGYCSRFEIYHGSPKGKIYDLVMRLVKPYLKKGHKLFVDNYYTSPILFHDLRELGTGGCGTLRANRKGVPDDIKSVKLKKGESVAMTNGILQILKWKDKRDVHICTSIHNAEFGNTGKNDRNTGQPIRKPVAILDYDKYMGAVDRCDQMISYPAFKRRTLKWWKKVFFHLLMLATLNAYLLYSEFCRKKNRKPVLHRVFRRQVAKSLISETNPPLPIVRGAVNPRDLDRLTGRHFISKIVQKEGQKSKPLRTCPVCNVPTGKRRTPGDARKVVRCTYECKDCDVGLCVDPCFRIYHTYKDYKTAHRRHTRVAEDSGGTDSDTN